MNDLERHPGGGSRREAAAALWLSVWLGLGLGSGLIALGCGPGVPGGPTMSGKLEDSPPPEGPKIQSNDILRRDARANRTRVKHILIGWKREGEATGASSPERDRAAADALAAELLERVRAGEPIEVLMMEYSEDPGSAKSGEAYEVTPDAALVFEFKRLGLRLDVGEAGLVLSDYGWHVVERVE